MMDTRPLAERIRPETLEDYIGQSHLIGKKGAITRHIHMGRVPSILFWGPPGVGKTTLARIIAGTSKCPFYSLSAVKNNVKDIRNIIDNARRNQGLFTSKKPILFIDEIHSFSKSQQDTLLGAVERGDITLLGATTENPGFEVIPALISRCHVYVLEPLSEEDLENLLIRAVEKDEFLCKKNIHLRETKTLVSLSDGDGRRLLNILELVVDAQSEKRSIIITDKIVAESVQKKSIRYDKHGDLHYDIVSAFIKSIRGSDPNATVYWLARMIEGGEDVSFIARRMLILAAEDIGNANPTALVIANNTFNAVNVIGYPEARIILSQCAIYLATSPKSNACYKAIDKALQLVKKTGALPVPIHLRNATNKLMKEFGHGKHYKYAHNYSDHFVEQEFFPESISNTKLYNPSNEQKESSIRDFLKKRWKNKYDY